MRRVTGRSQPEPVPAVSDRSVSEGERMSLHPLTRDYFNRDTTQVARDLLGCLLVHTVEGVPRIGRIVETEAYLGAHDKAAHSARGMTPRNQTMFGPPGHGYIYLVYGMHHCFNVVTEAEGHPSAVLIRALEPVSGITDRTRGPGLLCRAMAIDRRLDGCDLTTGALYIAAGDRSPAAIVRRPRIGVDYAGAWARRLLRFYEKGNPWVSKP
jgi:DNA-3-methyladenine glycosylase